MSAAAIRTHAWRGLRRFAAIATYLYVCFGALILFKSAILRGHGLDPVPWGFALVKALLLAKFIMVGQALHLGERFRSRPLIVPILHRSVVFMALLVALAVAEHVVAGLLHGRGPGPSLRELAGGSPFEAAATVLILWLVLVPFFAFRAIAEALGEDRLRRMLFGERRRSTG